MSHPKGFTERACINVYLEKSQKDFLTKLAREQKISPSEIVRRLITSNMNGD